MMPGLDGLSTLEQIKRADPNVPVIMITKNEEEHLMDEAIGRRIDDYLTKPVNPSQIFMACKQLLDARHIRQSQAGPATSLGPARSARRLQARLGRLGLTYIGSSASGTSKWCAWATLVSAR